MKLVSRLFKIASLAFAIAGAGSLAEAGSKVRRGESEAAVVAGLAKLVPGAVWHYRYNRPTPSFKSDITIEFVERRGQKLVFLQRGAHKVTAEDAARIESAANKGWVRILSRKSNKIETEYVSVFDENGRLVERGSVFGREVFRPHDCQRVQGECRYSLTSEEIGDTLYLVRTSAFRDGAWHFRVTLDPRREKGEENRVVEEGILSFGGDGLVLDSARYRKGKLYSILKRKN